MWTRGGHRVRLVVTPSLSGGFRVSAARREHLDCVGVYEPAEHTHNHRGRLVYKLASNPAEPAAPTGLRARLRLSLGNSGRIGR